MSFVPVVPSKVVEVLADGGWHRGELEGWRRDGVRWLGYVRWSTGVGMRRLGWVEATDSGLVVQQPRWTTPSAVRTDGATDGEALVTHGCLPQKCMDSGTAGYSGKFSGTPREGNPGMFIRRVLAAAVGAALVLTPLTAMGSNAQPGLVKQNAADYTPQLVPTAAVPRPSVDGIAAGPVTTYAGGHFDRVTGTSGAVTNIVAFDTATGAIKTAFGPTLDNVVRDVAYAPDTGGVYVGGDFTTVNGASASTLVKLNPNGTVAWKAPWTRGIVQDVDLVSVGGAPHLIVAGSFPQKLVSLNPSTGKDDGLIDQSITGEACLPDGTCSWGNTSVYDVAVANGHLVAVGNFAAPRAKFFMLDYNGTAFALSNWYYNSFAKPCSTTATRRIANLQGVDWNPNGQYFDVAATGQIPKNKSEIWHAKPSPDDPTQSDSTVCDAVGRFALTDPRKPVWINYTGGDSVWEVADTGAAVYIQGHFKWVDNADGYASNGIGDTSDGSPAARRAGIAALDPVAGRACSPTSVLATCSWSPAVPTKTGGRALEVTSQGLWAGTDSAKFAAEDHYGIAFAPL